MFARTGLFALNLGLLAQAFVPLPEHLTKNSTSAPACLGDWLDAESLGCFKFLETAVNLNWGEAQQKCEEIGGYLAEPRTFSQAEYLHDVAVVYESFTGIDHWWIGLSDVGHEGIWTWSHDGQALTDSSWGPGFPNANYGNTDDCGVMVVEPIQSYWKDTSCATTTVDQKKVTPVCQHDRLCPGGWTPFSGHCYLLVTNATNWDNAELDCYSKGGHLASVHSAEENTFIFNLQPDPKKWLVWIGASDTDVEGTWVWSDGTALDYSNWASGEPNGGTSYNCMLISPSNLFWYDEINCISESRPYVCKL